MWIIQIIADKYAFVAGQWWWKKRHCLSSGQAACNALADAPK
jgi:hypothetical protein